MISIILFGILFCLTTTIEAQVKYFEFDGDLFAQETNNPTNIRLRQVPVGKSNSGHQIYIQRDASDGLTGAGSTYTVPVSFASSANHIPSDQQRSLGTIIRTKKLLLLKFKKLLPAGIPLLTLPITLPIILRSNDGSEIPIDNIDEIQIVEVPEEPNKVSSAIPAVPAGRSSGIINVNSGARSNLKERPQKVILLDNIEFPKTINLAQQSNVKGRSLKPGETHSRFISVLTTQNRKVSKP